ncbi:CCR4-NOT TRANSCRIPTIONAL COMPLEX SUBUNIT CAF120-RELATED [Salix purpurea]|uniref:CCR4-NOT TRANSCRIPTIONAL COMPLEX SUBUNIT CAF120-RELATED n=1 Tax=Salix purpurea TaxID=77065 RepID=A0A9Q0WKN2_SALPP|nr:CCR4-NOT TRANSCRIPTIONAL COMPLEX SUBUNIT CAF120-RELATED [Salix purpurea]
MDWTRGQTIGRGSSATVSMARANGSGQVFAVKSAELSKSESLQKERSVLSTLRCPQIVAYKGCDITNENGKVLYNLFLEYASGGTLIDAAREGGGCLGEDTIRSHARKILLGLEYLHCNGIVHCDIKGHNILVTSDGAKIADLGCAKRVDEESGADWETTASIAGTPLYMAPEVARAEQQGFPADIWAVGCTVVEMATGQAPWANVADPVSALYQIGFSGNAPEIPSFMSTQAKDFLSKCMKRDPMESPNAETPTCVLDQVLWDSMEKSETTWDLTRSNTSPVSPIERMKQLADEERNGKAHNWSWDDSWVTIRSNNGSEEQEMVSWSEDYELAYADGSIGNSAAETTASLSMEYNFAILHEPTSISGNNTCNTSCSDGYRHKVLLMPSNCRKDTSCQQFRFFGGNKFLFSTSPCIFSDTVGLCLAV